MIKLILQISHALFRVSQNIKQKDIRSRIEANSVYLLEVSANLDIEATLKALTIIEQLVFLSEEIGEIEYYSGQILHKQFENLRKLILEDKERKRLELAIEDIFSGDYEKHIKDTPQSFNSNNSIKSSTGLDRMFTNRKLPTSDNEARIFSDANSNDKQSIDSDARSNQEMGQSSNRQELIAGKVAELGKAAMKDIIASFPNVSERTLRYDLQKLTDKHILERVGSGGPASFYTIKKSFIARDLIK